MVPRLVYISNTTELGTVYTCSELEALDRRLRCAAEGTDGLRRLLTVGVRAVAGGELHVRRAEGLVLSHVFSISLPKI